MQFRLRRDAGTFTFEGVVRSGVGAGTFTFAADPNFAGELAKRGFAQPTAIEQYQMARHDIGYAFVDELSEAGLREDDRPPSSFAPGSTASGRPTSGRWARSGIASDRWSRSITLRDHGVTPDLRS